MRDVRAGLHIAAWLSITATGCDLGGRAASEPDPHIAEKWPECGDGHVDEDEECDDGPDNGADKPCTPRCKRNVCGDGYPLAELEACDLGTGNGDVAPCTSACQKARCGDGLVSRAEEECDPANPASNGPCSETCRAGLSHRTIGYGELEDSALSPDGQRLAIANTRGIQVWHTANGRLLASLEFPGDEPLQVAWYEGADRLVAVTKTGGLLTWGWKKQEQPQTHRFEHDVRFVATTPKGNVAVVVHGGYAEVLRITDDRLVSVEKRWHRGLVLLLFTLDGQTLLKVFKTSLLTHPLGPTATRGRPRRSVDAFDTDGREIKAAAVAKDGKTIALATDQSLRIFAMDTGELKTTLDVVAEAVALGPDEHQLHVGLRTGTVETWDWAAGEVVHRTSLGDEKIEKLDLSDDGERLVATSWTEVALLDAKRHTLLRSWRFPLWHARTVDPDRLRLAAVRSDGNIAYLERGTWRLIPSPKSVEIRGISLHPQGRSLALATKSGVRTYDTRTGKLVARTSEQSNTVIYSPDGSYLASVGRARAGSADNPVILYRATAGGGIGKTIWSGTCDAGGYSSLPVFSPHGNILAVSRDGLRNMVTLVDPRKPDGAPSFYLSGDFFYCNRSLPVLSAFFPDRDRMLTSTWDQELRVLSTRDGKVLGTWGGPRCSSGDARILPLEKGSVLVATDRLAAVSLTDFESLFEIPVPFHEHPSSAFFYGGAKKRLVVEWTRGWVEIWSVQPTALLYRFRIAAKGRVDLETGFDKRRRSLIAYDNAMIRAWDLADQLR